MSRTRLRFTTCVPILGVFALPPLAGGGCGPRIVTPIDTADGGPTGGGGAGGGEATNGRGGAAGASAATGEGGSAGTPGTSGHAEGGSVDDASSGGGITGGGTPGPQFSCSRVGSQQFDPEVMSPYSVSAEVTQLVASTLALMGQAEKASQMLGVDGSKKDYQDIERSPDVAVPGFGTIRGYHYRDGSRGVNLQAGQPNRANDGNNFATAFPTPSIRAASWDLELEKRIGAAIGDETAASQNNVLLAPFVDSVRHPYWGRTQDTYGEDSYHLGRMGTAFTVGLQQYVIGCARDFLAGNIEKDGVKQNATLNEQSLREIYGRPFEMVIQDGGIGCVMTGYNLINAVKSTQNEHLLRDILKGPVDQGGFGFQGFVLSEWWSMPGYQTPPAPSLAQSLTNEAVAAGLDIEMPWTLHYSTGTLAKADSSLVEEAARRVLTQKYRFKTALDTDGWSAKTPASTLTEGSITASPDHEALAEEAEQKSAVLLTNGAGSNQPVLPLTSAAKIAVVGPDKVFRLVSSSVPKSCDDGSLGRSCTFHFATDPALGDRGSGLVNGDPARSVGPFAGILAAAGAGRTVTSGNSATAAASADAVVVVVGYTPGDEGEEYAVNTGGDRSTLDLPAGQNDFVSSVLDLGKPTVIVIESGSIVNLPWLAHANHHQATIWAGYSGLRGGAALGKLIFGAANFSGKMPLAWPTQAELDLMPFKDEDTETIMGYYFGYREYDRRKHIEQKPVDLVFSFGHGLSYSTFEYSSLRVPCETAAKNSVFEVTVDIKNTSTVDGDEVAMLFVKPPQKPANITGDRPWKELKSFARVSVPGGQTVTAHLPLRIQDLRRWEGAETGRWIIDTGDYTILVGRDAEDAEGTANQGTLHVDGD